MTTRSKVTTATQQFKEAAFTSRMASEDRSRARMDWKAQVATGGHPDETRRLEANLRIAEAREAIAQELEDEAWQHYLKAAGHG